jgi:hypothetical protein
METLADRLLEAKAVYWSIRIYNVTLDLIAGFMFAALAFQVAGVSLLYAILPAVVYALTQVFGGYKDRNIVHHLEGKYDNLDQRLQTAIEYQGAKNVIVEDLLTDVSKRMDDVETSTFMNSKSLSRRVYAIVVLSFLLLSATVLDLRSAAFDSLRYLLDATNTRGAVQNLAGQAGFGFDTLEGNRWEKSNYSSENKEKLGAQPGGERPGTSQGPIPGKGSGTGSDAGKDIYGDAKSASIAGRDMDFKLHPEYGGDIEIRETGGQKKEQEFKLDDVQSVDECVECVVGPEHEEVVRKYFEKILTET